MCMLIRIGYSKGHSQICKEPQKYNTHVPFFKNVLKIPCSQLWKDGEVIAKRKEVNSKTSKGQGYPETQHALTDLTKEAALVPVTRKNTVLVSVHPSRDAPYVPSTESSKSMGPSPSPGMSRPLSRKEPTPELSWEHTMFYYLSSFWLPARSRTRGAKML